MSDQHWSQMMLPRERIEQLENVNRELREENEVLREGMRKVNATAERHEREMYLAKDEAEALRAQLKETEEKGRVLMDMCRDLRARVAQLEAAALSAVQLMPGGQAKADLRDAYDAEENSEAWLLRKQAEAVEAAARELMPGRCGAPDDPSPEFNAACEVCADFSDYAQRLRQQADEIEKAGGEK